MTKPKQDKNQVILDIVKRNKIRFIELQFSDLSGSPKSIPMMADELPSVLKHGQWYDGSSIAGQARICESDMRLIPDISTFATLPWEIQGMKSARLICDIFTPEGSPYESDPRHILKKALQEASAMGYQYNVGPELEFFLLERSQLPLLVPHDQKSYFSDPGQGRSVGLIRKVMSAMPAFGIQGECHHHEVAHGQHEIDIRYGLALNMADSILTIKRLLKAFDKEFDLKATFMPKPIAGINGSGMHVHQSLFKKGINAFYNETDKLKLSKIAYQFVAGQLKFARPLCALVASSLNSYKRLVPGYEAPVNICWGQINRSALIRVPRYTPGKESATRLELRCPDPYANPYLVFAGMLACGLYGIKNRLLPPSPVNENVYHLNEERKKQLAIAELPASLMEANTELADCLPLTKLLGEDTIAKLIALGEKDSQSARQEITPWEIERYL